ncbi:MAG: SpoIIE family protein phosphatase [Gammaproteobacteria bacterium]|nr:SpoIIE family protein phosphatase [Gammaproteobacteria bacterium]
MSGDLPVVQAHDHGIMIGAIDGIGHGESAAAAADKARRIIAANASKPILQVVQRCHQELQSTRGVVMSLASIDYADQSLDWVGIGNVQALLIRADHSANPGRIELLLRSGVVGAQLPALQFETIAIEDSDLLIFATDGLRRGFADGLGTDGEAPSLARAILEQHRRGDDDALVVVARLT